ncbi:MAG: hypothetical protein COW08_03570 [Ignavibacteriales bacterium CG12_big_fil_rev_8_21_14_0_65_30_8]|nr:MAG: hypothetical protein COW08_03570 [Ignavibacteriales bacterium CG12_big_fil_rev_8_21_14_0_65_30_8]
MLKQIKYNSLIKQLKNKIFSYALFMVNNRMDAEDITQEVFIKLWDNFENINLTKAKSWLLSSTHNLSIDYIRKRKNKTRDTMDISENSISKEQNFLADPEISYKRNLLKDRINSSIKKLPDNLKSVFVLYEIEGFKYKEISKTLNVPINSVKVYLLRARKKLQEDLKEFRYEN